ncbi:methyltransferase domain-containing protein [Amycolatopsis jiangsuensis]|uniref:Protein-L-isoaspartate O-methyltransferase n=1 Tax=Amycolatopsis jiangsuensis TaxID=1181879 RepID=A0A840IVS7_9PSEU|nr:methyltransferase domain-containing protein [Amycolatopsis jiangsuensis]MBB4686656.1 methyltransferase of ATP-grasp peptide maturase system [Amycolatopsis jiangsuensis]
MAVQRLRRRLARQLVEEDVLHDERWIDAFRTVPRHVFLPRFFVPADGSWAAVDRADPGWLERVYSGDVLVTQLDDTPSRWEHARASGTVSGTPTSSSSMPAIMAIMLEELLVHDGDRVLEVGTGTGYNAGLLSHRCGSGQVSTVDIDADLLAAAQERLATCGYAPSCAVGDGALGFPAGIVFDRILCTAAVSTVPLAWLEQTVPGGYIVTTLNRPLGGGLVRLTVGPGTTAEGRVLARDGRFMPLRAHRLPVPAELPEPTEWRPTRLPVSLFVKPPLHFEFFASLELPGVQPMRVPDVAEHAFALVHPDGSWARTRRVDSGLEVAQGGPRALWGLAERAYLRWEALGKPERSRFGLTVNSAEQTFWLDSPDSAENWPL